MYLLCCFWLPTELSLVLAARHAAAGDLGPAVARYQHAAAAGWTGSGFWINAARLFAAAEMPGHAQAALRRLGSWPPPEADELREQLAERLRLSAPPGLAFDRPTVGSQLDWLLLACCLALLVVSGVDRRRARLWCGLLLAAWLAVSSYRILKPSPPLGVLLVDAELRTGNGLSFPRVVELPKLPAGWLLERLGGRPNGWVWVAVTGGGRGWLPDGLVQWDDEPWRAHGRAEMRP